MMNLVAGNVPEEMPGKDSGKKMLTMEEAVLGYHLFPKNRSLQWQGDLPVLTWTEGTDLWGEEVPGGEKKVLMNVEELNRVLEADLKGWPRYRWKDANTIVVTRQDKWYP